MVRAFAVCAVILAVRAASGQTTDSPAVPEPQPTVATLEPSVSACGEHDCSAPNAATRAERQPNDHALLRQKLAEMNCLQSEIEELRRATGTPQQVLIKMKVVEISRSKLKRLGIDAAALRGENKVANSEAYTPPKPAGVSTVETAAIENGDPILKLIDQLQQNGAARVLAEPNVAVTCGRTAKFNVGGEVPLPTLPGSNQAVEFKQFGTQIDVLAIAQGDHRVRLELRARFSELDLANQVKVAGVVVPGFNVRQVDSSLDLKLGQTGVLSGLVQQRAERDKFENRIEDHVEEIELLFLVTPETVPPMDVAPHDGVTDAAAYRTATSDSEERPNERSLRVTTPTSPR